MSGRRSMAVIGAGLMGHAIAQTFALAGWDVAAWDEDPATLASVPERIAANLLLAGSAESAPVRLASSSADVMSAVQLIVEAAPEDLDVKRSVVAAADRDAPGAIFATNTSVLPISRIAAGSAEPGRIVGTHWWNPAHLIPIVEVVPGEHTDPATTATVTGWLAEAGKTPVPVSRDVPGFVGNRLQFALWREAMHIVEEGIADAATVDLVARETFGRRIAVMGPLENADYIGLPLTRAIMGYVLPHLSDSDGPPAILQGFVDAGRLGAATGSGFHSWPSGSREAAARRLDEHLRRDGGA